MANTSMVSEINRDECEKSSSSSNKKGSSHESSRPSTPINSSKVSKVSGLGSFRGSLATEGISERAISLITESRRMGTRSNFESSWRKWPNWCLEKQVDPIRCNITFVLDFLVELFEMGLAYRTIGCHRSVISAYHEPIDGSPVGKHPRVSSLITEIFNKRPPSTKYTFVWDVEVVLKYIKQLPLDSTISNNKPSCNGA